MSNFSPLLSICVPTYNGLPYISVLIEELLKSTRTDFEVVISDDCSTDGTWEYVLAKSNDDPRVKCFRNISNLGMDRNFANSVVKARGVFVWLTGQDDKIFHGGVDAVAQCISNEEKLDFIHLNYTRVEEENISQVEIIPKFDKSHVFGYGLGTFLERTDGWLPTFLPLYIIRREAWNSIDIDYYFGTCFCQVGVFLELSEKVRWCHMDGNFVVGLTPMEGWQFKPLSYARIVYGNYIVMYRAYVKCTWLDINFLRTQYHQIITQLIFSIIQVRLYDLEVDKELTKEFLEAIQPVFIVSLTARLLLVMPKSLCKLLMFMIKLRRILRGCYKKLLKTFRLNMLRLG
jgi:glycosyltransferase involved in cell wall biosynthesis